MESASIVPDTSPRLTRRMLALAAAGAALGGLAALAGGDDAVAKMRGKRRRDANQSSAYSIGTGGQGGEGGKGGDANVNWP